ncbi:Qat anti-phage system QueC-like protein QatC [Acinetobacter baumannii]|nr:Qat anti-phage system QueC-like protein QatC [Acinetobacter baumannii]
MVKGGVRTKKIYINGHDSVCLFSGGLDSTIGAIDLKAQGKKSVLVSHAYPKDRQKQDHVYYDLQFDNARFQVLANPRKVKEIPADVQMRTRSFNFIAFGALIATALSKNHFSNKIIKLYIPENGLISINPPLTPRRIGALSTRTTHPYFLQKLNILFKNIGLPVEIENPYQYKTKGEMMLECKDQSSLKKIAATTVSCGKWKRSGMQCGKCLPCLIRRASFDKYQYKDLTQYQYSHLSDVVKHANKRDDLMSMVMAIHKIRSSSNTNLWVAKSGFLPTEPNERQLIINTVLRGFKEVEEYLKKENLGINI